MSRIKGSNTAPEILLRKSLSSKGIRYRINVTKYPGKPDIVIKKYGVIVFIDGEFWHGYKWKEKKKKIKSNRHYWIPKIERNIKRDKKVNRELRKKGWKVIRIWEHQIKMNHKKVLEKIIHYCNTANGKPIAHERYPLL